MRDNFQKLVLHVPSLSMFQHHSVEEILKLVHEFENPLLCLLACRWFEASRHVNASYFEATDVLDLQDLPVVMVVSDYASTYDSTFAAPAHEIRAQGNLVVKFSCVGDTEEGFLRGALNAFDYPKAKPVAADGFYALGSQRTHENSEIITVPMGCGSGWLPQVSARRDKVVLLDEVHGSVIDAFDDDGRFDVLAYKHALKICDHLWAKGFRVVTFCRSSAEFIRMIKQSHPYLEIIEWDGWMPFSEVVKHYAAAPLFFSHFHEAHGYPIYENLQIGNGVIGYVENINQHVVRQFQNGALLTLSMPPEFAAGLIDTYYERYIGANLKSVIAVDAHERFSCDTFVSRLVAAFEQKDIIFGA